jgi:hypothetical protein
MARQKKNYSGASNSRDASILQTPATAWMASTRMSAATRTTRKKMQDTHQKYEHQQRQGCKQQKV